MLRIKNNDQMINTWEKYLVEQSTEKPFFPPGEPFKPTFWHSVKYHLWHRWKNLRFGFYFKRDERDDDW